MDRALLTPKWIVTHVLMVTAVVVMVVLGFWQLSRLSQKQDRNAEVEARIDQPAVAIGNLVDVDDPFDVGADIRFRIATATGTYQGDDEILVRNRTLDGQPGFWLLTPLLLDDGTALVVNRGWVPFAMGPGQPRVGVEPPTEPVSITGMVLETVTAEGLTVADADGDIDSLGRVDLSRYADELDYDILPVQLQLESQQPPVGGALPTVLPRPELDEGPHLSYAVQWFIFAAIAGLGYPLVLRRLMRRDPDGVRHSDIPVDYL